LRRPQQLARHAVYPCVPGHKVVGRVTKATQNGKHKVGDIVGVGCMFDSCQRCAPLGLGSSRSKRIGFKRLILCFAA
jgi:uncharacterized zinc-type alcohol dehydrogenase-like protein